MTPKTERVLVVDDDPQVRDVLGRTLADGDYEVLSADDGREGLEMARAHRPALIILDVLMPKLDGYEVCAALQEDPDLSDIPVMMLTGLGAGEEIVRGLEAGADAYVSKPFSVAELLARAGNLIERSRYFVYTSRRKLA